MDTGKLDRWITGNWGEDHPDNVDDRSDRERHEAICRAMDRERLQRGYCPHCDTILTKQAYVDGACQECGKDLGVW